MDEKKITGNIDGISNRMLGEMSEMYDMTMSRDTFLSEELAQAMAYHTSQINREISVLINRSGVIKNVSIGESNRVQVPRMSTKRSDRRLSGVRCIHTHPGGTAQLSNVDYATLSDALLDSMAAIAVQDGKAVCMFAAFLTSEESKYETLGPIYPHAFESPELIQAIAYSDMDIGREKTHDLEKTQEFAILIGLKEEGMDELKDLAETAGAKVVLMEVQNRDVPDRATYIGRGKVDELNLKIGIHYADLLIINSEISPIQQRNLEERLGIKVVDRTALILDIFAMRAKSKEGCLQVELAQMKYLLPRLVGKGIALSRQGGAAGGGGIAARGPGETKLETDRRHIRRRMHALEDEIKQLGKQRKQRRSSRTNSGVPTIALVGYTNAGKSTLLNVLTGADAYVEDKLFATLDPLTRRMEIEGKELVVTDTVGFVQNLPHDLVKAFHSTLEEVTYADILLHVVDGSNPEMAGHIDVVREVVGSLGASDTPVIMVFNKTDLATEPVPSTMVGISAKNKVGIDELKAAILNTVTTLWKKETLRIPYSRSDLAAILHQGGTVLSEDYQEDAMVFEVELPASVSKKINNELRKDNRKLV